MTTAAEASLAVSVTVLGLPGDRVNEAGDALTEDGRPETVTVTAEVKPLVPLTDTLSDADPFGCNVAELGDTEIEKSPVGWVGLDPLGGCVLVPLEPSPQLERNASKTAKTSK